MAFVSFHPEIRWLEALGRDSQPLILAIGNKWSLNEAANAS